MIVPKAMLLISPLTMSRRTSTSSTRRTYNDNPMSSVKWTKMPPARMPAVLAAMVRQGNITIMATYLGTSRNSTGSSAIERNASTSSVTTMVPISAENDEPDRPTTTIAVISGPNSRVMLTATRLMTSCMAPSRRISAPPCSAMISPVQAAIRQTTGNALTPTTAICRTVVCQRGLLPVIGLARHDETTPR